MIDLLQATGPKYQVWLVRYCRWQPRLWTDLPPTCLTIKPADPQLVSRRQALRFVLAMNTIKLTRPDGVWAVAVPAEQRMQRLRVLKRGRLQRAG